jgi:ABC-type transporter MlaC component
MAKEILTVPEEHLQEVIDIIRAGLYVIGNVIKQEVREQLTRWCDEEQEYINRRSSAL